MAQPLLPAQLIDDFIIVSATAFTNNVPHAMIRDVLRGENLPLMEWRLVFSISRFGSCHLAYITQRASIDPAHGSGGATALERKGLISRVYNPKNQRRKLMSPTPEGVAVANRVWPQAQKLIAEITDKLNPQTLKTSSGCLI